MASVLAATATAAPPGPPAALSPFQFRPRHDSPDWRRLSAVDVERVAAEVDVAALQEHLGHVTFCNAARERCPHCQAPADPLLLKLLRLAQLCLEYLLHSQDYLSAQLRASQELLRAADAHRDLLAKDVARGAQEMRLLKEECKRRKKMIATQQMMLQAGATYHQCQFCDKAFMNHSFLHSHLQRRHAEETHIANQKKSPQTDKLEEEINKLKEQLQLTKSQLEAEQHAHVVKLTKEYEEHRSKEEEIRQLFHKWKEEEKEKLATELEKVKDMFMKEFKELSAKNTELENHLLEVQKSNKHLKSNLGTLKDSREFVEEKHRNVVDQQTITELLERQETKWTSKIQALQEDHENEKQQVAVLGVCSTEYSILCFCKTICLTSQIEKLKASMGEALNASNSFYKKRIEELGQSLQEQNDLIIAQKYQIQKLASRKSVESIKSSGVKASAQNIVQPKSSLPSAIVQPKSSLPSMHEKEKHSPRIERSKHVISTLKSNPSLTKELRVVLEQTLAEKLESLGIKSGIRGIPSDHLSRVLESVESAREERKKQVPNIQHIREQLERQVSFRVAERASCSRLLSSPHLSSVQQRRAHIGGSLSTVLTKPVKRSSIAKHQPVKRAIAVENTSTPKSKNSVLADEISRNLHSVTTPPFTSEEEVEEDGILQSYISPELSQPKASKSNSKSAVSRFASQSDMSSSEEEEVEEIKANPQPSRSSLIQRGTEQVEKLPLSQEKASKPTGELNVGLEPTERCTDGVKFTDVEDEDDWDFSFLEDEKPLPVKDEKTENVNPVEKDNLNPASMVHAWGAPTGKPKKDEGLQDVDKSSTLKSSLVTVTDWSDSSEI
uniref:Cilium assembly protein DZIP1 isoform X1 n=1 Tax=Pogona vitticeps TaxID=103695 RepID=A0ABM5FZG7_9SAUR